jgi:hypothetical protein
VYRWLKNDFKFITELNGARKRLREEADRGTAAGCGEQGR